MTPVSFRTDEAVLVELDHFANVRGTTRSALINRALKELLYRLACEQDVEVLDRELSEGVAPPGPFVSPDAQMWIEPAPGAPW